MFKNIGAIFTSAFFLNIIFVSALFLLIFISGISYRYTTSLTDSSRLAVHSYKIRTELLLLITHLKEAESGHRGFIITRDTLFLNPYHTAWEKINGSINNLRSLSGTNVEQLKKLDSLYKLILQRFNFLYYSLQFNPDLAVEYTRLKGSMADGERVMEKIKEQINDMIDFELMYLKVHQEIYQHEISLSPIYTLILLVFSLLVFIFAYFQIINNLKVLKDSNEKLLLANESIKHAEEIGDFCSWQWNLKTNEFIYSDNQYRLLGYEPHDFEPSFKKFLEFVHAEDRIILTQAGETVLKAKKGPSTVYFRIYKEDGELRYFKSIGKLFTDHENNQIVIGIHWDITELHLNRLSVEERNRELEQSNKELATFNHVASHDLQEPLRIIQTYISRIVELEKSTMGESSKGYYLRIQAGINRMRTLINDLLLYSRNNKGEKTSVLTDLNVLLENAKQELAHTIEEKKAILNAELLPFAQVIPFQIQQLFVNLIGNSLKFSKTNIPPEIAIKCQSIEVERYPMLKPNPHKKYFKISIVDNGLGFDQQYAENIFQLFYRLHLKNEYAGSGIGLSICKKIVENHGGIITAEGTPGLGATFHIIIPF